LVYIFSDPAILVEIEPWRADLVEQQNRVVGTTKVSLSTFGCKSNECNIGSFITDAFVDAVKESLPLG
jgi:2',3'-cyclic-nucleotide 2'-phosphodiesterase (5'-nucleotidase family)